MSVCKAYTSLKKVKWVGKDQFIIHKRELLDSWNWRTMSINCFRLINYLELCYLSSGGEENGNLIATYNQLEKYGIARKYIKSTISEAKKRGLIKYKTSENVGKYGKYTFQFCLTYLPQVAQDRHRKIYLMPTNEWKQIKKAGVQNDTYISGQKGTYKKQKPDKIGVPISGQKYTTIYILGDTYKNESEVVNE